MFLLSVLHAESIKDITGIHINLNIYVYIERKEDNFKATGHYRTLKKKKHKKFLLVVGVYPLVDDIVGLCYRLSVGCGRVYVLTYTYD